MTKPLSALEKILTMRSGNQCPAQYCVSRGNDVTISFCGLTKGHEGHHHGMGKRWDANGTRIKAKKP